MGNSDVKLSNINPDPTKWLDRITEFGRATCYSSFGVVAGAAIGGAVGAGVAGAAAGTIGTYAVEMAAVPAAFSGLSTFATILLGPPLLRPVSLGPISTAVGGTVGVAVAVGFSAAVPAGLCASVSAGLSLGVAAKLAFAAPALVSSDKPTQPRPLARKLGFVFPCLVVMASSTFTAYTIISTKLTRVAPVSAAPDAEFNVAAMDFKSARVKAAIETIKANGFSVACAKPAP